MLSVLSWNGLKAGQKQGATESQVEPFRSCTELPLARLRIACEIATASNLLFLVRACHVGVQSKSRTCRRHGDEGKTMSCLSGEIVPTPHYTQIV